MRAFVWRRGDLLEAVIPKGTDFYYFQADPEGRGSGKCENPDFSRYTPIEVDESAAAEFLSGVDCMYAASPEQDVSRGIVSPAAAAASREAILSGEALFAPYLDGLGTAEEIFAATLIPQQPAALDAIDIYKNRSDLI